MNKLPNKVIPDEKIYSFTVNFLKTYFDNMSEEDLQKMGKEQFEHTFTG